MTHLNIIIKNTRDTTRLLQKLAACYKTQFLALPDGKDAVFVHNYIKLLGNDEILSFSDT